MQDIHQLTLVLMQTLYLYVKDGSWIHFDTVVLTDIFCKANLVLIFDVHELLLSFFIVRINAKPGKCRQICDPLVSDMIRYPVSQQRICMQ